MSLSTVVVTEYSANSGFPWTQNCLFQTHEKKYTPYKSLKYIFFPHSLRNILIFFAIEVSWLQFLCIF
jgi:hypothetical protein